MNRHEYYGGPDWWSRIMAFGALLASLAALYLFYQQTRHAVPPEQQLAQLDSALDRWNREADGAINQFRTTANEQLSQNASELRQLSADLEQRERASNSTLAVQPDRQGTTAADHTQDPAALQDQLVDRLTPSGDNEPREFDLTTPDESDPNQLFADRDPELSGEEPPRSDPSATPPTADPLQLATGPRLLVARRAMRTSEDQLARAVIRNEGDEVATIDKVFFVPKEEVRVTAEAASRPEATDQLSRIQFGKTDNSSWEKGSHGAYRRVLSEPLVIAPGKEMEIDVEIQNREHWGWGLMGELTLVAGSESVTLEQATAIFRSADPDEPADVSPEVGGGEG